MRKNIGWESKCARQYGVFGVNVVETSVQVLGLQDAK